MIRMIILYLVSLASSRNNKDAVSYPSPSMPPTCQDILCVQCPPATHCPRRPPAPAGTISAFLPLFQFVKMMSRSYAINTLSLPPPEGPRPRGEGARGGGRSRGLGYKKGTDSKASKSKFPTDPNPAIDAHAVFPQSGRSRPEKWLFFHIFPHFSKREPSTKY